MRLIDADWLLEHYNLKDAVKYGNRDAEQQSNSYDTLMMYEIADLINDAPTIVPATNWIPCAERFPEDEDNFSPMGRYECTIQLPDGTRETFHLHRSDNGKWFYETGKGAEGIEGVHVVAWRHITDPYNPDHIPGTTKMMGGE